MLCAFFLEYSPRNVFVWTCAYSRVRLCDTMLSERDAVYEARVRIGLSKIKARSVRRCRGIQAQKSSVHCSDNKVAKIGVETQRLCMNKSQAGRVQLVNDPGLSVRCDALSRAGSGLTTRAYSWVVGGGERSSKVTSLVRYLRV